MPIDISSFNQDVQSMIVSMTSAKSDKPKIYGTVGICTVTSNQETSIKHPAWAAATIFKMKKPAFNYEEIDLSEDVVFNSEIEITKQPQHGQIKKTDERHAVYIAKKSFVGTDKVTFLVHNLMGETVEVIYHIKVRNQKLPNWTGDNWRELENLRKSYCPKEEWLISMGTENKYQLSNLTISAWSPFTLLSSFLSHATHSLTGFQNLAGTAVGNTTGSGLYAQITLDD